MDNFSGITLYKKNSMREKMIDFGFNEEDTKIIFEIFEKKAQINKRDTGKEIQAFCEFILNDISMEGYNNTICVDDIRQVAASIDIDVLSEIQIDEVLLRYPEEQELDPTGSWDLVVENILQDVTEKGYYFEYAIPSTDVIEICDKIGIILDDSQVREVQKLYYQDNGDKFANKEIILTNLIKALKH